MKKQGISLITLVITIVIIIVLAGAVILNLSDNNPIESAKKASVMQDIDTFRSELILTLSNMYKNYDFSSKNVNAVTKEEVLKYIPSMKDVKIGGTLYTDILVISEGELKVDGSKANECETNGKLKEKQYDWIVEALGNNVFNVQTYSIKYYTNDGTEEYTESSKIHNVKYSILSNSKDREGYGFKGWNTAIDGTGDTYNAGDEYTENLELTLYAQWEANTFTITYYKNDGTIEAKTDLKTQDVVYEITEQNFTREGYTFDGWNTKEDGTGTDYAVNSSYAENKELELYAKWNIVTYTVTYNANSGTNVPESQTKVYGVDLTLTESIPIRSGYTFDGWNTKIDGTGTNYAKGSNYTANANLTLYAKWKTGGISASTVKSNASKYYGAYVNYTPTNGCSVKWRVFLADDNNIYLIADDYVQNSYLTQTGFTNSTNSENSYKDYCVYSKISRNDTIVRLTTSSYYTGFKDSAGKALSVVGAPTLEQFVDSYNQVNTSKPLYIHYHSAEGSTYAYGGYTPKAEGYSLSFSKTTGYNYRQDISNSKLADLYYKNSQTKAFGMYLASFCAFSANSKVHTDYNGIMCPCSDGYVTWYAYDGLDNPTWRLH